MPGVIQSPPAVSQLRGWSEMLASLVFDAGLPYFNHLFESERAALGILESWLTRETSEFYIGRARLMMSDDEVPVGLSLTLSGAEVERCRRADMVALLADKSMNRSELLSRLRPLRELFAAVPSSVFYLSKISVRKENRGGGIGAALLDDVIARAAQREICLDVSTSNASAIGLYESRGFEVSSTTTALGMEYARLVLNAG